MFSAHKNAYLQSREQNLNPRILNRAVDAARGKPLRDPHDLLPPFQRLTSEQPCYPLENVDVSKRHVGFGRCALPLLRRELHCNDRMRVYQAICSISDLVHDPEKCYEAIRLRIPDRMADLLKHDSWAIRERVLITLTTMAGLMDGKTQISKNRVILKNLADLVPEEPDAVRLQTAVLLNTLSRNFTIGDDLYCFGFVEILLNNVSKIDPDIAVIHLDTLTFLMYGKGKLKALEHGAFNIFITLIDRDHRKLTTKAAECLTIITSAQKGKDIALDQQTLKILNRFIHYENPDIHTAALSALTFCTIKSKSKIEASEIDRLPDRLMQFVRNWQNSAAQLFSIKALGNICEYPKVRKDVKTRYYSEIKEIFPGNEDVKRHKDILIEILEFVPWIGVE